MRKSDHAPVQFRPGPIDNAAVQVRLGPIFKLIEDWRRVQPKILPRSEAIRQLLRLALETEQHRAAS